MKRQVTIQSLTASILLVLTVFAMSAVAQTTITPGDMVVVFGNAFGGAGGIIMVAPNGTQTVIACNPGPNCPVSGTTGFFQQPAALAIENSGPTRGDIVVSDRF